MIPVLIKDSLEISRELSYKRIQRLEKFDEALSKSENLFQEKIQPVLGIPINISLGRGRRQPDSPSLDKFYPEKGYVKGNIQVISWRANRIKSDGTSDEWIKIAKWCQEEDIKKRLFL